MKKRLESSPPAWYLGAAEINLAIERHQELDGFNLRIVLRQLAAFMDQFVGEVFDGVP